MVTRLFGNLQVTSKITDGGVEAFEITSGASDITHVVEVENWMTFPCDVEVEVELPDHHSHLAFVPGGAGWSDQVRDLAEDESKALGRSLDSTGKGSERVHCSSISYKKASTRRWHLASGVNRLALTLKVK